MAIKLSTKSGGGGLGLYMPTSTELVSGQLAFKTSRTTTIQSNSVTWVTNLASAASLNTGFSIAQLTVTSDTNEQTVVDISGSGVLTHVVGPGLTGAGTVTIRITVDGDVKTFTSETLAANAKYNAGYFPQWGASTTNTHGVGPGAWSDVGYETAGTLVTIYLPTPTEAILHGIGLKFESSLKVTVQGSVNLSTASGSKEVSAHYLNYIPEGM